MNSVFYKSRLPIFVLILSGWVFPALAQGRPVNLADSSADCLAKSLQQRESPFQLQTECPVIYITLQEKGLVATLEAPLPEWLSSAQLRLLLSATQRAESARLLDESELDSLLADIYIIKPEENTNNWWEQFLDWLKDFETEKYETEFNWLADFLRAISLSEENARIIMYGVIGLLFLLSIGFVFNELTLAGLFARKKRRDRQNRQVSLEAGDNVKTPLSFDEIKQLTPSLQTITLLKRVINHLMDNESLPKNTALSNFELRQCLQQKNAASTQPFSQLVADVEPVLYGNMTPSDTVLEQCWQHAGKILNS